MEKDEAILVANLENKIEQCLENSMMTSSNFLDLHQRSLAERLCRRQKDLDYLFYGGYEDAERTVAVFLPEYTRLEDNNPLALLRITQKGFKELSHRDYLGSLVSLGIKREMVGDILVKSDGADIIVLEKIAQFLLQNYEKAGRTNLQVEILPMEELVVPEARFQEKRDTVASLRLDNLVASAFSLSRGKAAEAITAGLVFLNGRQCEKVDRLVQEGDKLVLRGKGKVLLQTIGPTTKKDRTVIVLQKYL